MTATIPAPAVDDLAALAARAATLVAGHLGVDVPPYTVTTGSAARAATEVTGGRPTTPAAARLWLQVWAGGLRADATTVMTAHHERPVIVLHRRAVGWTWRVLVHELVHACQWDRPGALDTGVADQLHDEHEIEAYRIEAALADDVCPACGHPEAIARLDLSTARYDVADCRQCGATWKEMTR